MGFLKKLFGSSSASNPSNTTAASLTPSHPYEPSTLYHAAEGTILSPSTLPDPVFAGQLMGPTLVIQPNNGKIYAPAAGTISMIYPTGHAFGLRTENGAEILVHIGIDTVALEGKGFQVHVKEGQTVTPEQLIVTMDLQAVESAGYCTSVMVILTNPDGYQFPPLPAPGKSVSPSETIGKIVQKQK